MTWTKPDLSPKQADLLRQILAGKWPEGLSLAEMLRDGAAHNAKTVKTIERRPA